jgi:hypothetical protein
LSSISRAAPELSPGTLYLSICPSGDGLLRASSVLSVFAFQGGHWDLFFDLRRYSRGRSTVTPPQTPARQLWYPRIAPARRRRICSQRMAGSRSTTQQHNELSPEVSLELESSMRKAQLPKGLEDGSTRTFVQKWHGRV